MSRPSVPAHWSSPRSSAGPRPARRSASPAPPEPILDTLHGAIRQAVSALNTETETGTVTHSLVETAADPTEEGSTQTVRVDGPDSRAVLVRFSVSPCSSVPASPVSASEQTPYAVEVGINSGPLVRYTVCIPDSPPPTSSPSRPEKAAPVSPLTTLRRKAKTFLHRTLRRHLHVPDAPSSMPRLTLDTDGRIQSVSPAARKALEYAPDATPEPNFFSHVAACSLGRVLRDLGRMVNGDRRRAQWLVRLRTGTGRWRWYRTEVENELSSKDVITMTVWPLKPN